uniref:HPt domain-containing protein n=1 Tax=Panagrolaimus superbus TaxID=310955 RepID=A0A914YP03_9BILA
MPADTGIDDRRTGRLDCLRLLHDLFPVAAVVDQIHQRQAIDDDEVRAAGLADAAHDLDREAHALAGVTAPTVGALVGARGDEFVDEVALRAHHFDAVVAGLAGQLRAACVVGDMALDAAGRTHAG